MDTPETKDPRKPVQCFGIEATNRAKSLLENTKVYLEFDPANRIDRYGRTLAYVYREDNLFYNLDMIKEGYAHSYTKYPHPKLDEFNVAQKEARDNSKGFWAQDTCNGDTTQSAEKEQTESKPQPIKPITKPKPTNPPKQTTKPAPNNPPIVNPVPERLKPVSGVVKKSNSGICHSPGSTYYNRTKNYTPYNTIEECLQSGGRLPER